MDLSDISSARSMGVCMNARGIGMVELSVVHGVLRVKKLTCV
jgi:hypothetical protein